VHHSTVAAWRSQDPEFDTDVAAAEAQFIHGQLEIIKDAAKKGSWQASAWILERRLPAEFSQPQVQLSMPVNVEYKDLSVRLEELKQSRRLDVYSRQNSSRRLLLAATLNLLPHRVRSQRHCRRANQI
jgi:hypothetical protein